MQQWVIDTTRLLFCELKIERSYTSRPVIIEKIRGDARHGEED